jgi:hypothetical protein
MNSTRCIFLAWMMQFSLAQTPLVYLSAEETEAAPPRVQWAMDESYDGSEQTLFEQLRVKVPVLMRQTMIDIAVRLGLDFEEGWAYPLTVRFVDDSPSTVENALAYTQLFSDGGRFGQYLNINLSSYHRENYNFEKVFAHELVHAMVNDAIGAQAALVLPIWLHEGLAVYGANQGEQMVRSYVYQYFDNAEHRLVKGLESPHGALNYAEDYLAIKYIHDKHGVNSLHNFVHEVILRKGDVPGALQYTCFENWPDFQKNVDGFAKEEIATLLHNKHGSAGQPY